jgi:hypothetical protein
MSTFKTITADDIQTTTSTLNQLVDVVQEDISGSSTRKSFQVFVTGGVGPGVTSSLFQTVYDQDFSLQTSNAVMDMTVGLFFTGSTVVGASTGKDSNGKLLFPSRSLMMREKVDNYKQFAQVLLGDASGAFYAPGINAYDSTATNTGVQEGTAGDRIEEALFLNFKRLFARDEIRKETFAMRLYQTGALSRYESGGTVGVWANLAITSVSGSAIYADVGSSNTQLKYFGGDVGLIKNTSNTDDTVGLMWYDHGIGVLDMGKVFKATQVMSGSVNAMSVAATQVGAAASAGNGYNGTGVGVHPAGYMIMSGNFIPNFMVSGSIDNIINHVATTRFQSGSLTAATFQNVTNINSTLIFCRASADEFNYSSNPTFRDASGNIVVIDAGDDTGQRSFSFITTVGLYNSNNDLLAVAKLSRPIEKNDEKDLTIRVRLDF